MVDDIFDEVAQWRKDLESAEARHAKHMKRKCNWKDPEDRREYLREVRGRKRKEELDHCVPTRVCPSCGEVKLNNRQWVRSRRRRAYICRSCWTRLYNDVKLDKEGKLAVIRFKKAMARSKGNLVRFVFSPVTLDQAIQLAGMSKAHFSRRAGWSTSYTQKLVSGRVKSVNADTAKIILIVLKEGDVEYEMEKTDWEAIFGVDQE